MSIETKTVIVGMSGGVDSSVSAALLKEQGYRVIGLFMKNWEELDENGVCQSAKDYQDVVKVCEKLDIPYYSVDFVKEYRERVFQYFLDEYAKGNTPNPDILCNREIKFNVFFDYAMKMGADYLATGHYCRHVQHHGRSALAKGVDGNKDQTYFLYAIKRDVLTKVLFPVGDLPKPEVRKIAAKYDLATKDKKDSTGICFIGERNFKHFLSQYIQAQSGNFETLDGRVVGKHSGSAYYTIGQRKGLGLGGQGEPWFVVAKEHARNVVIVERGEHHPALYTKGLYGMDISLIDEETKLFVGMKLKAKVRYRQPDQDCTIVALKEGVSGYDHIEVEFDQPQRAVTPRQSIVFYQDDICLGGAVIDKSYPSYYELGLTFTPELGVVEI